MNIPNDISVIDMVLQSFAHKKNSESRLFDIKMD